MRRTTFRRIALLVLSGAVPVALSGPSSAVAAEHEAFVAACAKDRPETAAAGCACVAEKLGAALKDKELSFAFDTITLKAGEVSADRQDFSEAREDEILDMTFTTMKECGLAK
ncbi:MAG: hypothetical protein AB7E80_12235 [Hyphomicrobiaceae bacterium]